MIAYSRIELEGSRFLTYSDSEHTDVAHRHHHANLLPTANSSSGSLWSLLSGCNVGDFALRVDVEPWLLVKLPLAKDGGQRYVCRQFHFAKGG